MDPDDKKFIEEALYPLIRQSVRAQLDVTSPLFSVSSGIDDSKAPGSAEYVYIADGKKYLALAVKTPLLVNVSLLVDCAALKKYLLA